VEYIVEHHSLSIKQACTLLCRSRSFYYYRSKERSDEQLMDQLRILGASHPTYGFWKLYALLRRQGYMWNHKKVYRVYKLLKMNLQRRAKRRLPNRIKTPLNVPDRPNQVWSMDFMTDGLQCGQKFRTLNIIDDFNREALVIAAAPSIPSYAVVEQIQWLIKEKGKPQQIRVDNGPEFISNTFINFCNEKKIEINYIQPGKPMQNGFIERFNRSLRSEILDAYLFKSIKEVNELIQQWIIHYNEHRPHDALQGMAPIQYKEIFYKTESILINS
jgi:putative transposase